jgi:hypothetical protein
MKYAMNIVLAVALVVLTSEGVVRGQYQLGDGTGLDNNLQQGSGGVNSPKVRNTAGVYADAVITGNVTGLGAFRGEIDYGAPSEFRGQLSTDDNFSFYRQSYGSAAPLRSRVLGRSNIYGDVGRSPYGGGDSVMIRSGAGATLGGITGRGTDYSSVASVTRSDGGLISNYQSYTRSPRQFNRQTAYYSEQRLAVSRDEAGRMLEVTSSPLMGLNVRPITPSKSTTMGDSYATPADGVTDARLTGQLDVTEPLTDDRGRPISETQLIAQTVSLGERLGSQVLATQYLDQARPTESAEQLASVSKSLDVLLLGDRSVEPGQDVYMDLLGQIKRDALSDRANAAATQPEQGAEPGEAEPTEPTEPSEAENTRPTAPAVAERNAIIEAAMAKLNYDLEPLGTLAGSSRTLFNDAMREAESHMRKGRFFDAETAYDRALRLKPGYPTAMVGRAHAQIGAGVFASAARSLRAVYSNHPEMIAARYVQPLLPDDERLEWAVTRLEAQQEKNRASTGAPMLLAYIAYQQKDARALGAALFEMQKRDMSDPLLPLLQRIWGDMEGAQNHGDDSADD